MVSLLIALVSFLGGPLYVCDRLGHTPLSPNVAFALGAGPLLAWLVGLLTLYDEDDLIARIATRIGLVGATLMTGENLLALDGIVRARDAQNPGLHALGIAVGLLTALPYLGAARRKLRGEPIGLPLFALRIAPWLGDVLALLVCTAGAVAGLVLLPRERERALAVTILFGGMAAFMAWHIAGRIRYTRGAPAGDVPVVSGATLRPSRARTVLGFVALAIYGASIAWFGRTLALPLVLIALLLTALGVVGGVLALVRVIPPGFVRLEPEHLVVGMRRYVLAIPWSAIAAVSLVELHGTRMVALFVDDVASILVHPSKATERARRALACSEALTGIPLLVPTVAYAIDPRALVDAIASRLLASGEVSAD